MAKTKPEAEAIVALAFPRTGNSWMDAGTVGLYRVLTGCPSYLEATPGESLELPKTFPFSGVTATLEAERLIVGGPAAQVQACLEKAYDRLIACYYDVSNQKQRGDRKNYNFYFDSFTKGYVLFPKKKSAGAALLLFDKAARPAGKQSKWGPDATTGKPTPGRLPESMATLQETFDQFLAEHQIKPGPPAGLLIDAANEVRPKMVFNVSSKPSNKLCFLTGKRQAGLGEAKSTAFPLFGGSRSFVNGANEKVPHWLAIRLHGQIRPGGRIFLSARRCFALVLPRGPQFASDE